MDEFEQWGVSHHPATAPSQESLQPLLPFCHPTMESGPADHDLTVAGIERIESRTKRDFGMLEDLDTMRGLGVNGPRRVPSSVLIRETASRAQAEASQRSSVHMRFPEMAETKLPFLPFLE